MVCRWSLLATLAVVLGFAGLSTAAPLDVKALPPEIKQSLKRRFPKATPISAHTEGINHIEVKMRGSRGNTFEVVYKATYKAVVTEVAVKSLPTNVTNALSKRYPGATVRSAEALRNAKGNLLMYEVHFRHKDKAMVAYLTPKGTFVREP